MTEGAWLSLFSGGKDSSWALYAAQQEGLDPSRLVTVHPPPDAYLYHVPATQLAALAARSLGLELLDVEPSFTVDHEDAARQGDRELAPLEAAIRSVAAEQPVAGVIAGAVESEYQAGRLRGLCDRLGIDLFVPLWHAEPAGALRRMLAAGFEIVVVQVAARGLDASWIGRRLDDAALEELLALQRRFGLHPLGEGGEYESLVVDGPHMARRIEFDYSVEWEGDRGRIRVDDAWLE